jgi:hypothetical protein
MRRRAPTLPRSRPRRQSPPSKREFFNEIHVKRTLLLRRLTSELEGLLVAIGLDPRLQEVAVLHAVLISLVCLKGLRLGEERSNSSLTPGARLPEIR